MEGNIYLFFTIIKIIVVTQLLEIMHLDWWRPMHAYFHVGQICQSLFYKRNRKRLLCDEALTL